MKITKLATRNYRTLENLDLSFPSSYSAICGANDSGKTNVVRAIRALMGDDSPYTGLGLQDQAELSLRDDYTKWKTAPPGEREIELTLGLALDSVRDEGIYRFVTKQLSIETAGDPLQVEIQVFRVTESAQPVVRVLVGEKTYEGLEAQEVLKRL